MNTKGVFPSPGLKTKAVQSQKDLGLNLSSAPDQRYDLDGLLALSEPQLPLQ